MRFYRGTFQDESVFTSFFLQRPPAIGTPPPILVCNLHDLVGFRCFEPLSARSLVTWLGALGLTLCALIGLQGDLRRRGRRTKESLRGLAFLIAQLLLELQILFDQLVDLTLFFKAAWTIPTHCHQAFLPPRGTPLRSFLRRIDCPISSRFR